MRSALLASCALAAACSGTTEGISPGLSAAPIALIETRQAATEEPPARPGVGAIGGYLAGGEVRPRGRTVRFDVDALPVATWGEGAKGAGFTLHRIRDGWSLFVRTTLLAEVLVGSGGAESPGVSRPVGFTAFTAGSYGAGFVPECGAGHAGTRLAVWSGFAPAGWTDEGMNVEMGDGDFDLATCSAKPRRSLFGRAAAIVPRYVYGLRVHDQDDVGNPLDSLVVFLPRGELVSTAADPTMPLQAANTGPFTRLTLPLREGRAGAASVVLSPSSMRLWNGLRHLPVHDAPAKAPPAPQGNLVVGLDVTWQGDVKLGSLTLALPDDVDRRPYARLLAAAP